MRLRTLIRLWLWVTFMAIAAFAVLAYYETQLKAETGFNMRDLQFAASAYDFKRIFGAWIAREHAATAGFMLGFDYLFMPLYALSFYFSAMLAREAFAPTRGLRRRVIDYLGFVPLLGAIADAVENALEFSMLSGVATDQAAAIAYDATNVKTVCFGVGLVLLLAGIAGAIRLRRPKKEDSPSP